MSLHTQTRRVHHSQDARNCFSGANGERHDDAFYAAAKKRREEAAARDEDPYAEFKQKMADGRAAGDLPQSKKLWRRLTGKDGRQKQNTQG